ncbi:hypothetical protein ABEG18_08220 [Alsobacter sp. KACC 23698]|uniref:Uncharacterized protein n=1 Tax=Alsobacter sp. KACC 23698 TaxID=3149229 RepID=A0AAU7JK04_9HYPH
METNRIGFADLRRLRRDVFPQRVTSTDEAELLLAFDGALARADRDWTDYLTDAVGQFTLWGMDPHWRFTQSKALAVSRAGRSSAEIRDDHPEGPLSPGSRCGAGLPGMDPPEAPLQGFLVCASSHCGLSGGQL